MLLRDWPPSTVQLAPVTRLARSEARKLTTAATSSGRPKRPSGMSDLTKAVMPSGSACCRRSQDPPGNMIDPGATLLTRMLCAASSREFCEADFGGLRQVVAGAPAALPAVHRPEKHN